MFVLFHSILHWFVAFVLPVLFRLGLHSLLVSFPHWLGIDLGRFFEHVKFLIVADELEVERVGLDQASHGHTEGTKSSVSGNVFGWIGVEHVFTPLRAEEVSGAFMHAGESGIALDRRTKVVGNGAVSLQGYVVAVNTDWIGHGCSRGGL